MQSKGPEEARTQTLHTPVIAGVYKHFMQESNWYLQTRKTMNAF